jgi:hypothetical protein
VRIRSLVLSVLVMIFTASCSGGITGIVKKSNPVSETTVVKADRGPVVFSDDFTDSGSGWPKESVGDFSATFTRNGYVIVARRYIDHEAVAPYSIPKDQLSALVTATESTDSPSGSGIGANCDRGINDATLSYVFVVTIDGTWEARRYDTRKGATAPASSLKKGTSPKAAGAVPISVELMCATLSDGVTTRLVMFVNGTGVADITDRVDDLPKAGWLGGFVVRAQDTGITTVTATHFEERDLTG